MAEIVSSFCSSGMLAMRSGRYLRIGFTMALMGKKVAAAGMLKSKLTHFFQSLFRACVGINVFLSVFIHISAVYAPYVEPNKRVVQYPLGNFETTSSNL